MMRKFLSGSLAAALAVSLMFTSVAPLNAAPLFAPQPQQARSDIETVQFGPDGGKVIRKRKGKRPRAHFRRHDESGIHRRAKPSFHAHHGRPFYHGHPGYRTHRRGYRRYNGWWFPPSAFIVGSVVVHSARAHSNAHYEWCYARYRSYRAWDNTFQPYNGPRRQCYSPYR
jgi:hypothetical protein